MTDSDVLARAAKALRDAHTGERAASGFTRARIMNTLHRERRRRVLRWAVFSPLVSLLLVGSAWAQSTGQWPVLWRAVTAVFSATPAVPGPSSGAAPRRAPPRQRAEPAEQRAEPLAPAQPLPAEPLPVEPPAPADEPPSVTSRAPRAASQRSGLARPARPQRAPAPRRSEAERAASAPEPPAPVAPDRELTVFRAAHDLHFRGDRAREAIAAYDAYLREYPHGRFVPEARYNGALDHIKLGERDAAREALEPFAAGSYGGYRQREANELLDALR